MGAATVVETDEERAARLEAEQAELDAEREAQGVEPEPEKDGQARARRVESPPEELVVAGTVPLDGLGGFGGKKPTGAVITLQGLGSIPIMAGQGYEKGQYVRFEGMALVEEGRERDKVDRKAGVAVDCKMSFFAYATDVRVFGGEGPRLPDAAGLEERVTTALELLRSEEPDVETIAQLLEQGLGS